MDPLEQQFSRDSNRVKLMYESVKTFNYQFLYNCEYFVTFWYQEVKNKIEYYQV